MCINCPDFVDMCWEDECYTPEGGIYNKAAKFYADMEYCRHLKAKYGHDIALLEDRYGREDT